jgi:FkbM family methyltransferase
VLDIGGNVGMFAAWAAGRWPAAHITSFEPSPESTVVFREWQARSGLDVELSRPAR